MSEQTTKQKAKKPPVKKAKKPPVKKTKKPPVKKTKKTTAKKKQKPTIPLMRVDAALPKVLAYIVYNEYGDVEIPEVRTLSKRIVVDLIELSSFDLP